MSPKNAHSNKKLLLNESIKCVNLIAYIGQTILISSSYLYAKHE